MPKQKRTEQSKALASTLGLDRVVEHGATADMEILQNLLDVMPSDGYALIGGGAVVVHLSKQFRDISPDVDLLTNIEAIKVVKESGQFRMMPNRFGVTVITPGMGIDLMLATRRVERAAIREAQVKNVGGVKMRVAQLAHVVALKVIVSRDKDQDDVVTILTLYPEVMLDARRLLKQTAPDSVDDLASLYALAQLNG